MHGSIRTKRNETTMTFDTTKLFAVTAAFFLGAAAAAGMGCSDDHDHDDNAHADGGHTSEYPVCKAIIDVCHEVDMGDPGQIHDCHEIAHNAAALKSDAKCVESRDVCVAICSAAHGDAGAADGDAGAPDAGGENHDGH